MYVSDRADPSGVLLRARLNCLQWQGLSTDNKHRLVDYHYSAFGLTMNALGRSQIVAEVNRYCEAVRGSGRPYYRPAGAVVQNADGSYSSDTTTNISGSTDSTGADATFSTSDADYRASVFGHDLAGSTGSTNPDYLGLLGKFLQGVPGAVSGIVASLNETQRAQVSASNQQAIARIAAQAQQTNNQQAQQNLTNQLTLLRQFQSTINPPKNYTPFILAGAGILLIGAVALLANRKR